MRALYVRWVDSANLFGDRWASRDELKEHQEETYCETLGWVIEENDHSFYIASSIAPEEIGSVMQIPRVAIKDLQELNVGETEQQAAQETSVLVLRGAKPLISSTGQEPRCQCESACKPGCKGWTNVEGAGVEDRR